jgi:hypothetical protein
MERFCDPEAAARFVRLVATLVEWITVSTIQQVMH